MKHITDEDAQIFATVKMEEPVSQPYQPVKGTNPAVNMPQGRIHSPPGEKKTIRRDAV